MQAENQTYQERSSIGQRIECLHLLRREWCRVRAAARLRNQLRPPLDQTIEMEMLIADQAVRYRG